MILVDSSVMIDYLNGTKNEGVEKLDHILSLRIPFGITNHIYQELLQGTASVRDFQRLKEYLDTFTFYDPRRGRESFEGAARIFYNCKRGGITIRNSVDCLIVQIALENRLALLHNDRDFEFIQKVVSDLRFY